MTHFKNQTPFNLVEEEISARRLAKAKVERWEGNRVWTIYYILRPYWKEKRKLWRQESKEALRSKFFFFNYTSFNGEI